MTLAERNVPRHDLTRNREHAVDPHTLFYGYLKHRIGPEKAIVHTAPDDDKIAQQVFGERMHNLRAISYKPKDTGLWVVTIDGLTNSDLFHGIIRSPTSVVATSFSSSNPEEYHDASYYFHQRMQRLGYIQHAQPRVTTDGGDPFPLSRSFFVPEANGK